MTDDPNDKTKQTATAYRACKSDKTENAQWLNKER